MQPFHMKEINKAQALNLSTMTVNISHQIQANW